MIEKFNQFKLNTFSEFISNNTQFFRELPPPPAPPSPIYRRYSINFKFSQHLATIYNKNCRWGEYMPWEIRMQIQTTREFSVLRTKFEKFQKQQSQSFFLFKIHIHYSLYREFSNPTWKKLSLSANPHPKCDVDVLHRPASHPIFSCWVG